MAKKFIDAEMLYEKINEIGGCDADPDTWADGWDKAITDVLNIIDEFPAADVQEVSHGKWIKQDSFICIEDYAVDEYKCSICGSIKPYGLDKYCSHCGAEMSEN